MTQVDLRRLSDGIKVTERFRTQETVERAYIDEREFQYLFQEGDTYTFMDIETYDQIQVSKDIIGDPAVFLQFTDDLAVLGVHSRPSLADSAKESRQAGANCKMLRSISP